MILFYGSWLDIYSAPKLKMRKIAQHVATLNVSFDLVKRTSQVDLKSKSCQDLNHQLAIYQAFHNTHAAAAILRQLMNIALFLR